MEVAGDGLPEVSGFARRDPGGTSEGFLSNRAASSPSRRATARKEWGPCQKGNRTPGGERDRCIYDYLHQRTDAGYHYEDYRVALQELPSTPTFVRESAVDNVMAGVNRLVAVNPSLISYNESISRTFLWVRYVNRLPFLTTALRTGDASTTMTMTSQVLALAVLMRRLLGRRNSKVLVAGCGLGDWALELALALGGGSRVWCFNAGAAVTEESIRIITTTPRHVLVDVPALESKPSRLDRVAEIQSGTSETFGWICSEPGEYCSHMRGSGAGTEVQPGLRTFQADVVAASLGIKFDAIVFGNSLRPEELKAVRDALEPDGTAVVPVCHSVQETKTPSVLRYCVNGMWWKLGPKGHPENPLLPAPKDRTLFEYKKIMRPVNSSKMARSNSLAISMWRRQKPVREMQDDFELRPSSYVLIALALGCLLCICRFCCQRDFSRKKSKKRRARDLDGDLPASVPGRWSEPME